MSAITEQARDAWLILETAELRGLPMPTTIRTTSHSGTEFGLRTAEEFDAWAAALEAEPKRTPFGESLLHSVASGVLNAWPVTVYVLAPAAVEVTS